MSFKVIRTCIKWNSFSLALNNGPRILLTAAVGLMLNSHRDGCLCVALGEYICPFPSCHMSAFNSQCFSNCFLNFSFMSLDAFWLVWDLESVPPNLCCCLNPDAWLAPFSFAWPRGVCVIYGKWNPALKSTLFPFNTLYSDSTLLFCQVPWFRLATGWAKDFGVGEC